MSEITQPMEVPPPSARPEIPMNQPVAPYWHTALVVVIMAAVALLSAAGQKGRVGSPLNAYITTMIWQWMLFALVLWGLWRRGIRPGDVLGRPWKGFDDVMMDVVYAAGFLVGSRVVLGIIIVGAMRIFGLPQDTFSLKKSVDAVSALTPHSAVEVVFWIGLSITAGIVEEFVFRGYLQRQMIALTRSAAAGIILSAVVFGLAHAYQGGTQMVIITALGAMFGVLAYWRRSLRPGIIAHAGQDIFAGLAISWLSRTLRS